MGGGLSSSCSSYFSRVSGLTTYLVCLQVATELVIGFPPGYLTKGLLDRQKCLFATWLAGFVALPINLPGFGV